MYPCDLKKKIPTPDIQLRGISIKFPLRYTIIKTHMNVPLLDMCITS